jgi:hypothetical protein
MFSRFIPLTTVFLFRILSPEKVDARAINFARHLPAVRDGYLARAWRTMGTKQLLKSRHDFSFETGAPAFQSRYHFPMTVDHPK